LSILALKIKKREKMFKLKMDPGIKKKIGEMLFPKLGYGFKPPMINKKHHL
jgi:hypothetical protein